MVVQMVGMVGLVIVLDVLPEDVLLLGVVVAEHTEPSHLKVDHLHVNFQSPETGSFKTTLGTLSEVFLFDFREFLFLMSFISSIIKLSFRTADILKLLLHDKSLASLLITGRV